MFYQETLKRNGPQVGIYESGDIPNAILTEKYVFILTVGVLPDLEKDSYHYADQETYHWYNDEYKVGDMRFYSLYFFIIVYGFYFKSIMEVDERFFQLKQIEGRYFHKKY